MSCPPSWDQNQGSREWQEKARAILSWWEQEQCSQNALSSFHQDLSLKAFLNVLGQQNAIVNVCISPSYKPGKQMISLWPWPLWSLCPWALNPGRWWRMKWHLFSTDQATPSCSGLKRPQQHRRNDMTFTMSPSFPKPVHLQRLHLPSGRSHNRD